MSSIHYKFGSLTSYKTVNFDTLNVSVKDLKQVIFDNEGLSDETFDLEVQSSYSNRVYSNDDIIPRNSSLIIKRLPRSVSSKIEEIPQSTSTSDDQKVKLKTFVPKIEEISQPTSISDVVPKIEEISQPTSDVVPKIEEIPQSTEQKKIKIVQQSSYETHPDKYNSSLIDPPINYICNRCNQPGHFLMNCPMANVLKLTGIPIEDLVETTADHPYATFHPSGRFMVHRMHVNTRMSSKPKFPFIRDENRKSTDELESKAEKKSRPELICPICCELMSEAVVMVCCGFSFCAVCIQNLIVEDPNQKCPGKGCPKLISIDSMVKNVHLRKVITAYQMDEYQWQNLDPASNVKESTMEPH